MYSSQTKRANSLQPRTDKVVTGTDKLLGKEIKRRAQSQLLSPVLPSQKLHPLPPLPRIELKKPNLTKNLAKSQEVNNVKNVLEHPKTRFNTNRRFKTCESNVKIIQCNSVKRSKLPENLPPKENNSGILPESSHEFICQSVSSCSTELSSPSGFLNIANLSRSSHSNDEGCTLLRFRYISPNIEDEYNCNENKDLEHTNGSDKVHVPFSDQENNKKETDSKIIKGTDVDKMDDREPVHASQLKRMSNDEFKPSTSKELSNNCIKSDTLDEDVYDSCSDDNFITNRKDEEVKFGDTSSQSCVNKCSQEIANVISGDSSHLEPIKNLAPQHEDYASSLKRLRKKYADKMLSLKINTKKLKEDQETVIELTQVVNNLFCGFEDQCKVKPVQSLIHIEIDKVKDFITDDGSVSFEQLMYESDCESSQSMVSLPISNELEQTKEDILDEVTSALNDFIVKSKKVANELKTQYQDIILWITEIAKQGQVLSPAPHANTVADFCTIHAKSRDSYYNLSPECNVRASYLSKKTNFLLIQIECLNLEQLKNKFKRLNKKKVKLEKRLMSIISENELMACQQKINIKELSQMHAAGIVQERKIKELEEAIHSLTIDYNQTHVVTGKIQDYITALQKKLACNESETQQKFQTHDEIINSSLSKIATLGHRTPILKESFYDTLDLKETIESQLQDTIRKLQSEIDRLTKKLHSDKQLKLKLNEDLKENANYIVKAEYAMETLILKTDPKFRQPYPLKDIDPRDREQRVSATLKRKKAALEKMKSKVRRPRGEDIEQAVTDDEEMTKLRHELKEKEMEAEKNWKVNEELQKEMEKRGEELRQYQQVAKEIRDGAQLAKEKCVLNDLHSCISYLTESHTDLVVRAQRSEKSLTAKMFEIMLREEYVRSEATVNTGRERLIALINERRSLRGDEGEVVRIVDMNNTYYKMMVKMASQRNATIKSLETGEEKDQSIREMERDLNNAANERLVLERRIAALKYKLSEYNWEQPEQDV